MTTDPYADEPEKDPCYEKPTPKPTGPTDRESAVDLFDPIALLETFPEHFTKLYGEFGVTVKLLEGTPILIHEYILVDDEPKLRFMNQKGDYRLDVITDELYRPVVTVKRYTFCGGKALVLLGSDKPLDSLYSLSVDHPIRATSLSGHDSGYIKPGGTIRTGKGQDGLNTNKWGSGQDGLNTNKSGSGQDGNSPDSDEDSIGGLNTNKSGSGQGYSNCLGHVHPSHTLSNKPEMNQEDLTGTDPCLKVAILDSGIKFKNEVLFQPTDGQSPCREVATGWDFVKDDNRPDDEQTNLHGTRVANIIRSICKEATLIPVRISDKNNVCTLYDVLCGLEYAAQQGVRIINASLAFSTRPGTIIPLLQASLRRLAYRGILVVCASGNVGFVKREDLDAIPHIGKKRKKRTIPMQWPACASEELTNVIAVTSVVADEWQKTNKKGERVSFTRRVVCELRSKRYITVGVVANGLDQIGNFGSFITPNLNDFRGTSFAAPYVTGKIANAILVRADLSSRVDVLRAIGATHDSQLKKQIREGIWTKAD